MEECAYFITVEHCSNGKRGIICDGNGVGFRKTMKDGPHTGFEMCKILGLFWIILEPKSELFSESEAKEYCWWVPLAEYSHVLGIALKEDSNEISSD